jgi:hypothetical protein
LPSASVMPACVGTADKHTFHWNKPRTSQVLNHVHSISSAVVGAIMYKSQCWCHNQLASTNTSSPIILQPPSGSNRGHIMS